MEGHISTSSMSWSFEVIFSENVGETETLISASGISKWIEVDTFIFTTQSPANDIGLNLTIVSQVTIILNE